MPSRRVLFVLIGFTTAALAAALILRAWWVTAAYPGWWAESGRLPADAAERAEALERGITRAIHEPRAPDEPWTVSLTEADANAWLAHRMLAWAANRGMEWESFFSDDRAEPPRAHFEDGRICIGVVVRTGWGRRVLVVSFAPKVSADSTDRPILLATDARFAIGRFSLDHRDARRGIIENLPVRMSPEVQGMLDGVQPIVSPAVLDLDGSRRISLLDLRVEPGRLLITSMTSSPRE